MFLRIYDISGSFFSFILRLAFKLLSDMTRNEKAVALAACMPSL